MKDLPIPFSDVLKIIDLNWNLKDISYFAKVTRDALNNPNRKLNANILVLLSPQTRISESCIRRFHRSRDIIGLIQNMLHK